MEIKHVHSPEVIVVLDPRYDLSYKALYISTCSIALKVFIVSMELTEETNERFNFDSALCIGWYMLLEHQVIWCQGEAAGPNHGARKAYTNRLSTWFAPKI